jgi:hypothetical protein
LVAHPEKVLYQQHDRLASLRKQWCIIQMLTKQCTQLRNQLHGLLNTANPELLRFCQDGMPKWLFTLLLKYPTPANLKKARAKTLAKIAFVTSKQLPTFQPGSRFQQSGRYRQRVLAFSDQFHYPCSRVV